MKNTVKLLVVIAACVFLSSCASQEKVKVRFRTTGTSEGGQPNIYIDDKLIGAADFNQLTIDLKPGKHQVRAVSPGWETLEITIHVQPKGEASVQSANNAGIQQLFRLNLKKKE